MGSTTLTGKTRIHMMVDHCDILPHPAAMADILGVAYGSVTGRISSLRTMGYVIETMPDGRYFVKHRPARNQHSVTPLPYSMVDSDNCVQQEERAPGQDVAAVVAQGLLEIVAELKRLSTK